MLMNPTVCFGHERLSDFGYSFLASVLRDNSLSGVAGLADMVGAERGWSKELSV